MCHEIHETLLLMLQESEEPPWMFFEIGHKQWHNHQPELVGGIVFVNGGLQYKGLEKGRVPFHSPPSLQSCFSFSGCALRMALPTIPTSKNGCYPLEN